MFAHQLRAAVEAAPRERLSDLSGALWKGLAAGALSEGEAEEISGLIEARRATVKLKDSSVWTGANMRASHIQLRRPQRPPVRSVAIERRRRLAASGPMPPALAARFTTGELAVLRIVADECRDRGSCTLCLDAVAARAGVSRSLAKGAIRNARRLGMVEVLERRRTGAKSLPNVVTVVDREWLAWIGHGARRNSIPGEIGGRILPTTEILGFREGERHGPRRHRRSPAPREKGARFSRGSEKMG